MPSIIIPAHNEEKVIARCLRELTADSALEGAEIFVVCNGCSDKTAEIASQFAGVRAVSIDTASKIAALNEGDRLATQFPRVYLDADVLVSGESLKKAMRGLELLGVEVVAPRLRVDLSGSNIFVNAFYAVWLKLPYFAANHMVGSGIYILSEAGRARFGKFPQIISDDGYVRSLFKPGERKTVGDSHFTIFAPKSLASLIKIKTRARFGNMQVVRQFPGSELGGENSLKSLVALILKKPYLLPAAVIYVYTQWLTKLKSRKKFREQDFGTWERDESTR